MRRFPMPVHQYPCEAPPERDEEFWKQKTVSRISLRLKRFAMLRLRSFSASRLMPLLVALPAHSALSQAARALNLAVPALGEQGRNRRILI